MIEAENLVRSYNGTRGLAGFQLRVEPSELFGLVADMNHGLDDLDGQVDAAEQRNHDRQHQQAEEPPGCFHRRGEDRKPPLQLVELAHGWEGEPSGDQEQHHERHG